MRAKFPDQQKCQYNEICPELCETAFGHQLSEHMGNLLGVVCNPFCNLLFAGIVLTFKGSRLHLLDHVEGVEADSRC